MSRSTRRVIRYETRLPADEVQSRLQRAVDPPGMVERARRTVREPETSDFYGVIDRWSFWIRRWNLRGNTWKPTARGRVDTTDAGSVVSVEIERPNTSWFVPAIVIVWVLAVVGASLTYGSLPPGDLLLGGTAIALFGVGLGLAGPRVADYERDEIESLLSHVLDCQGVVVPSL